MQVGGVVQAAHVRLHWLPTEDNLDRPSVRVGRLQVDIPHGRNIPTCARVSSDLSLG